jgi:hypothetical protein
LIAHTFFTQNEHQDPKGNGSTYQFNLPNAPAGSHSNAEKQSAGLAV